MLKYIFTLVFPSILASLVLAQSNLSYEDCNCLNESLTRRMTSEYPRDKICQDCCPPKGSSAFEAIDRLVGLKTIPAECILASNLNETSISGKNLYRQCDPSRKTRYEKDAVPRPPECKEEDKAPQWSYVRRPCINKDYVEATTAALNNVAECLDVPAKQLFPLFNHESRFLLNNRSPTGALCHGQLTAATVETLNNYDGMDYDNYAKRNDKAVSREVFESFRLNNIMAKCPTVSAYFKKLNTRRIVLKNKNEVVTYNKQEDHCEVVENPYTCLLYSALNFKVNRDMLAVIVSKATVWASTNQKDGKQIIHKDKDTLEDFRVKTLQSEKWNYLKYKEVPVFSDPEQVVELAAYLSHNAGNGGGKIMLEDYVRDLQRRLDNSNNVELRTHFLTSGVSTSKFLEEYKSYVQGNYRWGDNNRKEEVASFVGKIISDAGKVTQSLDYGTYMCLDPRSYVFEANAGKGES